MSTYSPFGWDLPPGVSQRDCDDAFEVCKYCDDRRSDYICRRCAAEIAAEERYERQDEPEGHVSAGARPSPRQRLRRRVFLLEARAKGK